MSPTTPDDARQDQGQAVRQALAELLGTSELDIVAKRTARTPSGETVTYLAAVDPSHPNRVAALTVDESGTIRPRAELEERAGRRLFLPEFPTRPSGKILAREPVTIDPKSNDWRLSQCETRPRDHHSDGPANRSGSEGRRLPAGRHTGSMSAILDAVKAGAAAILGDPALAAFDVAWGVGNYRDFPVPAPSTRTRSSTSSRRPTNQTQVDAEIGSLGC